MSWRYYFVLFIVFAFVFFSNPDSVKIVSEILERIGAAFHALSFS
jgi:hypothetical protein